MSMSASDDARIERLRALCDEAQHLKEVADSLVADLSEQIRRSRQTLRGTDSSHHHPERRRRPRSTNRKPSRD
jgi:hypothetical protein